MSRDEILAMPAGRRMDELITEMVMGERAYAPIILPSSGAETIVWMGTEYSTDISAAWEVVEKLQKEPHAWQFEIANLTDGKAHLATLWGDGDEGMVYFNARAETMPLAICRAALLAVSNE